MDNIIIENKSPLCKSDFIEWMARINPMKYFAIILACISLIGFVLSVVFHEYNYTFVFPFAIALLYLFFYPRYIGGLRYKQSIMTHESMRQGQPFVNTYRFYIDHVDCINGDSVICNISYSNVKKCIKSKNLIIIKCKHRLYLILNKNGFTIGTAPDLFRLINEE